MPIFRAILAVAAVFIGGIAAFLGTVVMISSLQSGSIQMVYGQAAPETITRASDAARYWQLLGAVGIAPLIAGLAAVGWGWRRIRG